MTAADSLRSAEQRAVLLLHSGRVLFALLVALVLIGTYRLGVGQGRASQELEHIDHALENNAHALETASRHRDSTKVVAQAAVQHSDSQRVVTRTTRGKFAVVDDSTVAIKVPARPVSTETNASTGTTSDADTSRTGPASSSMIDSLVHMPLPVIAYIHQADAQIHDDSVTIVRLTDDIDALEVKDSLHVEREKELGQKVDIVGGQQFRRGIQVGAIVVVALRGVVWLVLHH